MMRAAILVVLAAGVGALKAPSAGSHAVRQGAAVAEDWGAAVQRASRSLLSVAVAVGSLSTGAISPALAEEKSAGFEEFAAQGGKMEARPQCFFDECGDQSKACFGNPSCLKGVTCLGNCRGEQECATRCFSRFGSEKLNAWLSCTLEEKSCVTTGVAQDTSAFYAEAPRRLERFDASELEGKWWKVLGYSAKYDCFPCQANTFRAGGAPAVKNEIEFRVPKPGGGYWQNAFTESMVAEPGPQGKASFTVEGKMYGLTFHEQWYVLGKGDKAAPFVLVAYKGDTQQGPYEGGFLYTRGKGDYADNAKLRSTVDAIASRNGLNPANFCPIDNACPMDDVQQAGASAADTAAEKLTWKDVFDLAEWFRPGTLQKSDSFDPNKMT